MFSEVGHGAPRYHHAPLHVHRLVGRLRAVPVVVGKCVRVSWPSSFGSLADQLALCARQTKVQSCAAGLRQREDLADAFFTLQEHVLLQDLNARGPWTSSLQCCSCFVFARAGECARAGPQHRSVQCWWMFQCPLLSQAREPLGNLKSALD